MSKKTEAPSSAAAAYVEAHSDLLGAETMRVCGDAQCGDLIEADACQRLAELERPATVGQLEQSGVAVEQDGADLRLRDTAQSPTLLAANAHVKRLGLAQEAGALDLAIDVAATIEPTNSLERMLGDQMAATHAHAMRLIRQADKWLHISETETAFHRGRAVEASVEAARLTNAAARMMTAFQDGMATLARVRSGGQRVTVVHQHVQVAGGQVAVAGHVAGKEGGDGAGQRYP
jgi:hypothetical protein